MNGARPSRFAQPLASCSTIKAKLFPSAASRSAGFRPPAALSTRTDMVVKLLTAFPILATRGT